MSLASASRYMAALERLGVFQRQRQPGGRYRYILAEAYRPRWPGRVPAPQAGVSQAARQKANHAKYLEKERFAGLQDDDARWEARLRSWHRSRFWLPLWGPKPTEPGCFVPSQLLTR